jgi:CSLREA domain-containing protein
MTAHLVRRMLCVGAACALLLGFLSSAGSVRAASLTVDTLTDENDGSCSAGHCSLRDAIGVASPGDTIVFKVKGTISLKYGELTVS